MGHARRRPCSKRGSGEHTLRWGDMERSLHFHRQCMLTFFIAVTVAALSGCEHWCNLAVRLGQWKTALRSRLA